jgi:hypothetical protein
MHRFWVAAACALLASGCAVTVPVAVIAPKGQILRGTATASMSGSGTFSVTDGKLTCAGSYNSLDMSPTITMAVLCDDGRKGIITASRNGDGLNGAGRVRLTDGTEGDFIFGSQAAAF